MWSALSPLALSGSETIRDAMYATLKDVASRCLEYPSPEYERDGSVKSLKAASVDSVSWLDLEGRPA